MYINKSYNIKDFPFHECRNLWADDLTMWASAHRLVYHTSWMLPQIVAHYGTWEVDPSDPKSTLKRNMTSEWEIGLWKLVTQANRGLLVKKQSDLGSVMYSALVPIILYGIRQAKGIKYSEWATEGLEHLVGTDLYEAMTYVPPDLIKERLLDIRRIGLMVYSGKKQGESQNPVSAWKLSRMQTTELAAAPRLAVSMLTQTWVAHPSIRHSAMILNPSDWDNMPEPLTTSKVVVEEEQTRPIHDLPWL